MREILLTLGLCFVLSGAAQAKIPTDVMTAYKAYAAALKENDIEAAQKHAYDAWQKAEELIGDSKITGDLAFNYSDMNSKKKDKTRLKAIQRSIELSSFYGTDAALTQLERYIKLIMYHKISGNPFKMYSEAKKASKFAEENSLTNTTFYGEALTFQAEWFVSKGNHEKTHELSEAAISAFESATYKVQSVQPLIANLYAGFGNEGQDNTLEAALNYQKVMQAIDGIKPTEHPLAANALGRWSHMRTRLRTEGRLDEAESMGLCRCWPYDKPRNESIKPIERVPPVMPSKAKRVGVSGYSIVEFDLSDDGKVINPNILVSWPEGFYEKSSLKALEKWKYSERMSEETDADREDIVVTLRYQLSDWSGDVIY